MPRYYRKVLRITAADSPNVALALEQQARGQEPTGGQVTPGVLSWDEYKKRRATWDRVRQCVGLDAEFWEGADLLLYPPDWLNRAERMAAALRGKHRQAEAIGIDPAEGGDKTCMTAVDRLGIIEQVSKPTPDTAVIRGEAIAFGRRHNVPANRWYIDAGGGGTEHGHYLRQDGYQVNIIPFGGAPSLPLKRGLHPFGDRQEVVEDRAAYVNRRAEMYGALRELLDPGEGGPLESSRQTFAIPAELTELRHQLSVMPLLWDREGRMRMLPKHRTAKDGKEKTLVELIGHSPDEADSLVLACWGMLQKGRRAKAGVS